MFNNLKGGKLMDLTTSLKILVSKKGVPYALAILSSPDLPEYIKEDLAKNNYLVNGTPNFEMISSLASTLILALD